MRRAHVSCCLENGPGLPEKAISRLSGASDEKRQAGDRWHQLPRHIAPASRSPAAESPSPSPEFRCLSPDVKCPLSLITRHGTVWVLPQCHHFSKEPAVSPTARAASRSVRRGSVRLRTHRARCRGRRGSREQLCRKGARFLLLLCPKRERLMLLTWALQLPRNLISGEGDGRNQRWAQQPRASRGHAGPSRQRFSSELGVLRQKQHTLNPECLKETNKETWPQAEPRWREKRGERSRSHRHRHQTGGDTAQGTRSFGTLSFFIKKTDIL